MFKDSAIWDIYVLKHLILLGASDGLLWSPFILLMVPIINYIQNIMKVGWNLFLEAEPESK